MYQYELKNLRLAIDSTLVLLHKKKIQSTVHFELNVLFKNKYCSPLLQPFSNYFIFLHTLLVLFLI